MPLKRARLLAPVLYPGNIYCAGANYTDHMAEMARAQGQAPGPTMKELGEQPWHFVKTSRSSVVGPGARVKLPVYSQMVDWEVELAAVIGKAAKDVPVEKALDYVAGYTIANDLSARDVMKRDKNPATSPFHYDWLSQKCFDGACPLGPWIVPASEIPYPQNLALKLTEDPRLVTGRGQYVEDIKLPGLAHLAFLRSPHAHARVTALRTEAARAAPGVVRVVTARDLGSLRPLPFMATLPGLKQAQCPYLAGAVVDSTGVPVAAVVAESPSLARDAAELIEVEYDPLPPVADPERGLEPGAPLAHPELGTNQAFAWPLKGGDVDGAFSRAAHIVRVRLDHNRLAAAPMEPRGVLARYDPASEELTLWLTTQNPFLSRADLAAVTGFPEHKLRVIAPDVGGGFGVKGPLYPEEIVAATLARQLGRPIRWMSTRTEDLLTTIQARAAVSEAEGALTADGEQVLGAGRDPSD